MKLPVIGLMLLASLVTLYAAFQGRRPHSQVESSASIAGRVTLRGEPVEGAMVLAMSAPPTGREQQASAKTDADGQYRITNLTPGKYRVVAHAPGFASPEEASGRFGREINLDTGETLDKIDFALVRGGVI